MKTTEDRFREQLTKLASIAAELRAERHGREPKALDGSSAAKLLGKLEETLEPLRFVGYRLGVPVFTDARVEDDSARFFEDGSPVPDDEAEALAANERLLAPAREAEAEKDAKRAAIQAQLDAQHEKGLAEAREAGRRNA